MNLYLQVLTQNQTSEALRLLEWPALLQNQDEPSQAGRIGISSGGTLRRSRFTSLEHQVAKLRELRFNEVEVSYELSRGRVLDVDAELRALTGLFRPAVSNELWFPSSDWPAAGDRSTRNRRMNSRSKETALEHFHVRTAPVIFEVVLELATRLAPDAVLDALARWICLVPAHVYSLTPFGCCDAAGPEYFVRIESNVMMTEGIRVMARIYPDSYPLLGERFDSLHPLMFGRSDVCGGIASTVSEGTQLYHGSAYRGFAVVRLTASACTLEAKRRASRWTIGAPEGLTRMSEPNIAPNGGPATSLAVRKSRRGRHG